MPAVVSIHELSSAERKAVRMLGYEDSGNWANGDGWVEMGWLAVFQRSFPAQGWEHAVRIEEPESGQVRSALPNGMVGEPRCKFMCTAQHAQWHRP